ncbi:MAG TPA: endonuclease/exonuclease/phosphatase family protein, partial [Bdellovibrionota bacterium]|nr:endonuclease/exonuclease/phosphatase family protein [Bdellovibrionota bacterium]
MKIASWNVNSIKVRLPLFSEWVAETKPDIILLQETKCQNEAFPAEFIEDMGYNIAIHGQKTFNGVAILSKFPLEDVQYNLPHFSDPQARYIDAFTGGVRVA